MALPHLSAVAPSADPALTIDHRPSTIAALSEEGEMGMGVGGAAAGGARQLAAAAETSALHPRDLLPSPLSPFPPGNLQSHDFGSFGCLH